MDDLFKLLFYLIIFGLWALSQGWGRTRRRNRDEDTWAGRVPPRPQQRPAPQQPTTSGRKIVVRSRLPADTAPAPRRMPPALPAPSPAVDVTFALEALFAERAKAPPPASPVLTPAAVEAPVSRWAALLSSQEKIAEGIILSAILGPPKASGYLRRVTRYGP